MKYINNIYLSIPVILLLMYFPVVAQQSDLVEHITVETSLNQVFISSRPVIQSPEDLNRYLELTRSRLDLVDSGTEISAVVTFTRPMSYNELSAIFGSQIGGSLVITGDQTDPLEIPYPLPPDDSDLNNSDSVIIAAKVYGNAGFVKGLAGQDNILCVDIGPVALLQKYDNAILILRHNIFAESRKYAGGNSLFKAGKDGTGKFESIDRNLAYQLFQNQPNPANPSTQISFQIPEYTRVKLKIYDMLGQPVKTLVDRHLEPGSYNISWDGKGIDGAHLSTGIYLIYLQSSNFTQVKKMIMLK